MTIIRPDEDPPHRQHNQSAWDKLAAGGHPLTKPAEDRLFANPMASVDPCGWLGPTISNQRVLCLAAGGGRQGPLYAAAGAHVTVVDLSDNMLQLDREVARQRKLNLVTIQTSMDDLSMFTDSQFDLVIHPVSTCYVADVGQVYREVARVLRRGGLYISQHKQPTNLQAELTSDPRGGYRLVQPYYQTGPLEEFQGKSPLRERGTQEYIHRWDQLLGLMCRAGFVIEDLLEPLHAKKEADRDTLGHRSQFIPPYVRIKARLVKER